MYLGHVYVYIFVCVRGHMHVSVCVYVYGATQKPKLTHWIWCIVCRSPCSAAASADSGLATVHIVAAAAAGVIVVVVVLGQRFRFTNMMTVARQESIEGRVRGCNASSPIIVATDLYLRS